MLPVMDWALAMVVLTLLMTQQARRLRLHLQSVDLAAKM
jgi:hypothetical protein